MLLALGVPLDCPKTSVIDGTAAELTTKLGVPRHIVTYEETIIREFLKTAKARLDRQGEGEGQIRRKPRRLTKRKRKKESTKKEREPEKGKKERKGREKRRKKGEREEGKGREGTTRVKRT